MAASDEHERRFHGDPARLRSPDRVAMLEPERVVALSLDGASMRTALDVGTGTGLFAQAFSAAGVSVTGVDIRPDLLGLARRHVPGGRFVEAAAEALPFRDDSFDLVLLAHVLHETDDPLRTLREAARTARSRVVIVEWPFRNEECGPPLEHRLRQETIEALARSAGLVAGKRVALSHMELYTFAPK